VYTDITSHTTISSLADYERQLNLSYNKLFLKSVLPSGDHSVIVNTTSLTNKYYDYILESVRGLILDDKEYLKYRFQPKMFCYDIYGTTELWALLLKINNFNSVAEFNSKKIKVFGINIFNILNEILINEEQNILENYDSINY